MRIRSLRTYRPGRVPWREAWELQKRLAARAAAEPHVAHFLLLEHPPVFTLGRNALVGNVLLSPEDLAARGITLEKTDRGGDVTYHGPGQVVGYPILHLPTWGLTVSDFVHGMEDAMKKTCARFGVVASARPDRIGLWVGEKKIGSIGIHVSRGVTTHGFALNACPDLEPFSLINPCGIAGCPVTSLAQEGADRVTWAAAADAAARAVADLLAPDRLEAAQP